MNLIINSKFRPFTYDEMVKPLVQYKEAYDAVEEDYSNLAAQTEMWRNIVNQTNNPEAYEMYQNYSNDLASITEDFSRGMNLNNRSALLQMKRRYASDIQPIADAHKRKTTLIDEQRKLSANNPSLMFDRDFSDVSLDEIMRDPNLSYRTIDGNDFYAKGAAITKAMSSRLNSVNPALRGQYWEIKKGFGEEAANQFLLDSGAIPELNKALNDLVSTADVPENLKDRVFEYAKQGAISGMVGESSYQTNRGYESSSDVSRRIQSKELFDIQMGRTPYRIDEDGTKHYVNSVANNTWSVSPDGTVTDTTSNEDIIIPKSNSEKRIEAYRASNTRNNKSEVTAFKVGDEDELTSLTREDNLDDYNYLYNNMSNLKVVPVSSYIGNDTNSKAAKAIKAALYGTGLTINDVEILSNRDIKEWGNDEIILIRTKSTSSSSNSNSNRSNIVG